MDKVKAKFGKILRKARLEAGKSQEDLAGDAGLHRTYISSVERGERNITIVNIYRLAKALSIDAKDLLP